jgi:hypothetical protein
MRRQFYVALLLVAIAGVCYASQSQGKKPDAGSVVGTWAGTWAGDSSGKFDMTINSIAGGKLSGSLTAHPTDGGDYTASLKSVDLVGTKLTVKFNDPSDDQVEIVIEGTIESGTIKGTWSVHSRAESGQTAGGTWSATKK